MGLNLTLGYAGQVSLAQAAFVGIGAYTAALLTTAGLALLRRLRARRRALLRRRLAARLSGAAGPAPLSRLRDARLLDAGLPGLPQRGMADRRHLRHHQHPAAEPVRHLDRTARCAFYYFCLGMLALVSAAMWWLIRSPWGRAFMALRENPDPRRSRSASTPAATRCWPSPSARPRRALPARSTRRWSSSSTPRLSRSRLSLNLLLMVVVGGAGYLLRAVPRRAGRRAAAGMAALRGRALPHHLCADRHGAAGLLAGRPARPRRPLLADRRTRAASAPAPRRRRRREARVDEHGPRSPQTAQALRRHHRGGRRLVRGGEGEILGIIGPNGCGKSTLFNCILGQLGRPRARSSSTARDVTGMRPSDLNRLGVSRTFQLLQVFPQLIGAREPDPRRPGASRHDAVAPVRPARCRAGGSRRADDRLLQARAIWPTRRRAA